jgi:hypothetical protein
MLLGAFFDVPQDIGSQRWVRCKKAQGGRTARSPATAIGRRPTSYRSKASKWERLPRWPVRRNSGNAKALEPEELESGTTRRNSPRETVVVLVRGDVLRGVVALGGDLYNQE